MGSFLDDWPSYDPHNFSQLRPADPSAQPSVDFMFVLNGLARKLTPVTYNPTHGGTIPPKDQVISTDARNILLRHFYQKSEKLRLKRAASDHLKSEHNCKQPRGASGDDDS